MGALAGLRAGDVERLVWDSGIEDAGEAGAPSDGHSTPSAARSARRSAAGIGWRRGASRCSSIRHRGAGTALLASGATASPPIPGYLMREHFDALVPELRAIFGEAMAVAAEFGTKKPIRTSIAASPQTARRRPHEAMMIDDKPGHIAGARNAGLEGHVFTGIDGLTERLQALRLIWTLEQACGTLPCPSGRDCHARTARSRNRPARPARPSWKAPRFAKVEVRRRGPALAASKDFAERDGRRDRAFGRRAKYLLADLDDPARCW